MSNFLTRYLRESTQELRRVSWPTKNQAVNLSIIVITGVFLSALLIAGIDFAFNEGYNALLNLR